MLSENKLPGVWADIKEYRRAYTLTAVASFGGMLFGWDTVSASIYSIITTS
jgi:SP family sugar:H+ symporter-like MFS transporter